MQLSFGSKLIYLFEPGSWSEALFDVVVGSLTGVIRAFHVFWRCVYVNVVRPIGNLVGFQMSEGKRPKVADGKLKVAAVGFSRTGTVRFVFANRCNPFIGLNFLTRRDVVLCCNSARRNGVSNISYD